MDYLDGELAVDTRSVFERHLAVCPECRAYLESYQVTLQLERVAFEDFDSDAMAPPPEDLVNAVIASLSSAPRNV